MTDLRTPPFNVDSETAVLSTLMLNPATWDDIGDILTPPMFYIFKHQILFKAIHYLANANRAIDPITIIDCLDRSSSDEKITFDDLTQMITNAVGDINHVAYAKIIRDKYLLRSIAAITGEISSMVYNKENIEAEEVLNIAESKIMAIGDSSTASNSGPVHMGAIAMQALEAAEERRDNPSSLLGLSWGMRDVDSITDGLHKSDLIIVAGRPSMGKTSFVMNVAANVGILSRDPKPVAVFSMEMPNSQLAQRMQASIGRIQLSKVRAGSMSPAEWSKATEATNRIGKGLMHVDDTPALTPGQVRARCRRLHRETGGLGLVVIDYLQLMESDGTRENRTNEVSEISRNLKALAKELNVPVIALSQLNRSLEQRADKRPVMSDLRESGAIEQDADVIAFIYRDEVYDPASNWKGTAEVLFRKQRNGPVGTVRLSFNGMYTLFDNWIDNRYDDTSYGAMTGTDS